MIVTKEANIPAELRELDQWVNYKLIPKRGQPKRTKVPYNPRTGAEASTTDPSTWSSFEVANKAQGYDGYGFVVSEYNPYTGIDLDNCIADGVIEPAAMGIVKAFNSYTERSQSGTGIHIFVRGRKPGDRCKHTKRNIETYDKERFFVMTGDHFEGTPLTINERQAELDAFYFELFPKEKSSAQPAQQPPAAIPTDDIELVDRMFASTNGDKIRRLWDGDTNGHSKDHSSADLALCNFLAFWTGNDAARMDRLFRQSKLYRAKWDRQDYRTRTINEAIATTTEVYKGSRGKQQQTARVDTEIADLPTATRYVNGNGNDAGHSPSPYDSFFDKPHNTDMGNAKRMYDHAKDRVMYVSQFGKWFTWAGTHWPEDDTFEVLAIAKQTVLSMYKELSLIPDDNQRKEQLKWIVSSENRARLESMIALLRSEPGISVRPDALDRHPMLLPVKNGTIDLATGDLLPSDPAHKFTKFIDIDYDPGAECPLWERFLIRIMGGNLELVSFIQRLVGHALTGDATGKYFVFMWGEKGNNGKSTLAETVMRLLGPFAMKSPTEMVMAKAYRGGVPNDIARLRGVRFTVANEVDEGMTLSEGVIKDLTGQDTLSARFMRGEFFDFAPTHKLWMYGNHRPEIRGTNAAIWDRVKLIPFNVEIPESERDPQLQDKLAAELPGILAWAVRGCLQWQKVGINAPEIVKVATGEYRAEQDMLAQFIDDCCETGRSCEVGASTIYQAYEGWCKETGIKPDTGTKFGRELGKRGFDVERKGKGKSRLGIRLNEYGRNLLPTPPAHWSEEL